MKISTKGRYALRVMLDLAENHTGAYIPLKEVSARQGITKNYLDQIVPSLSKAGFLKSSHGPSGGYRLSRKPEEYKVGDILRLVEGNLAVVACLEDETNECPRSGNCKTLPFWEGLNAVVEQYMDGITLKDLMSGTAQTTQKPCPLSVEDQ